MYVIRGSGDWVTEGIVSQGVGVRKLYRLATPQCVESNSPRLVLPQPIPYLTMFVSGARGAALPNERFGAKLEKGREPSCDALGLPLGRILVACVAVFVSGIASEPKGCASS
jgi:hypothetical protein